MEGQRRYKKRIKGCLDCEKKTAVCSRREILNCLVGSKCTQCHFEGYNFKYGMIEGRCCSRCGSEWPIYK